MDFYELVHTMTSKSKKTGRFQHFPCLLDTIALGGLLDQLFQEVSRFFVEPETHERRCEMVADDLVFGVSREGLFQDRDSGVGFPGAIVGGSQLGG